MVSVGASSVALSLEWVPDLGFHKRSWPVYLFPVLRYDTLTLDSLADNEW